MKKTAIRDKYFIILLIIIAVAVGFRLYHANHKKVHHIDEFLSFKIANTTFGNNESDGSFYKKWNTGRDYIDHYFTIKKENLVRDILSLAKNTKDSSHPNLYYIILRFAVSGGIEGFEGRFTYYGVGLNIFIFCLGAFFLYLLFADIYENKSYAFFAVFLYGISLGAISNSLFIRMYELFSTLVIITTFLVFKLLDKDKPSHLDLLILFFVFISGYLTHYYYLVFLFLLSLLVFYHCWKMKQGKKFIFYIAVVAMGFIAAQIIYCRFIPNLSSYRAKEVYAKLNITSFFNRFLHKAEVVYELITENIIYFFIPIVLSIFILSIYHLLKRNKGLFIPKELYLFILSISFSILVIFISPYETLRYLYGILSLLFVVPIIFIRLLPLKSLKYLMAVFLCFLYIFGNFSTSFIKRSEIGRFIFPGPHYLKENLIFRNKPEIPAYFVSSRKDKMALVIAYFHEAQKYKLNTDTVSVLNLNETGEKELFIIIEKNKNEKSVIRQIEKANWKIKEERNYRDCYRILMIQKNV